MSEYIRREDVLNLPQSIERNLCGEIVERSIDVKDIESLKPADVVPVVHAYWRDTGSGQECSACKEIQYGYDTGRHYCPNCGAKMDGERKE